MNLTSLSLAELRDLQEQLMRELKKREQEEIAKAREQILAIARSVGMPIEVLIGSRDQTNTSTALGKVAVRYRHPSNASLEWTGRGKQPKWIREWVASGRTLEELRV